MSESYGRIIELLAIERDTETFGLRIKAIPNRISGAIMVNR